MWHACPAGWWSASAIAAAAMLAPVLSAQHSGTPPHTSAVAPSVHGGTPLPSTTGRMRDLRCRGKSGIDLRVHQDPSPRSATHVTMVLRYDRPKEVRSVGQEGMGLVDYGMSLQFIPGSCTWRFAGVTDIPAEPGILYFDILRDAQTWRRPGTRDTTLDVAMNFPDVEAITRYLNDSTRYWGFYVDDVTNISISSGPRQRPAPPIDYGSGRRDSTAGTTHTGATPRADTAPSRPATTRGGTMRAPAGTREGTSHAPNAPPRPGARRSVRIAISAFTVLKSPPDAQALTHRIVAWTDVGRGGSFQLCQGATCQNTGDVLRLLVFATPPSATGSVFTTPGWKTEASVIVGIARREFDLRSIHGDRPLRAFTLRSNAGEIEFEVQGTLEVVRR